jgi:hypothetical protein
MAMLAKNLISVELISWQRRMRLVLESGGKGGSSFKGGEVKWWNMGCGGYLTRLMTGVLKLVYLN